MTPKQLHHLATRPAAYLRFMATGRPPRTVVPKSPLIDLLEQIGPRDRCAIRGLRVDGRLGYFGSRQFHNAEQALKWLKPESEMLEDQSWPAESWRLKAFQGHLTLETLLANAASYPDSLKARYPRL